MHSMRRYGANKNVFSKRLVFELQVSCSHLKTYFQSFLSRLSPEPVKCLSEWNRRIWPMNSPSQRISGSNPRLRSASTQSLLVHRTRLSTVGDRAFPVAAPRTWNALPRHVTFASSLPPKWPILCRVGR